MMYDIKSNPVFYHMNEELTDESESKYTYIKIKPSTYVILKRTDLCQCFLTVGSWNLEANIAYCTQESSNKLSLFYTVNMATIVY